MNRIQIQRVLSLGGFLAQCGTEAAGALVERIRLSAVCGTTLQPLIELVPRSSLAMIGLPAPGQLGLGRRIDQYQVAVDARVLGATI